VSTDQFVPHDGKAGSGFIIPKFASSQQWGCPVTTYYTSMASLYTVPHNELNDPVDYSTNRYVYPKVSTDHKMHKFWINAQTDSGANGMFGEFNLFVGCTEEANNVIDASNFTSSVPLITGKNDTSAYIIEEPISALSWCHPES
jgi:hypothetical protein